MNITLIKTVGREQTFEYMGDQRSMKFTTTKGRADAEKFFHRMFKGDLPRVISGELASRWDNRRA